MLPVQCVQSGSNCVEKVHIAELMLMWSVSKNVGLGNISNIDIFIKYTCSNVSSKNADEVSSVSLIHFCDLVQTDSLNELNKRIH